MSNSSSPTVDDMMAAYALDAVDHARSAFGESLDFSPASVQRVEVEAAGNRRRQPAEFRR